MPNHTTWKNPPAILPPLSPTEVHIWRADLNPPPAEIDKFWQTLADNEKARAQRFKFPIHQRRSIVSRGILRQLLASYLHQPAHSLVFSYNPHGKPQLVFPSLPLQFNASDSQELAVFAFTLENAIGIDLEFIKADIEAEAIGQRYFSTEEMWALSQVPDDKKNEAFFSLWTRKEAFIKAIGEGLFFPLKEFTVNLQEEAQLLSIHEDKEAAKHWTLRAFSPEENFKGAVAIDGQIKNFQFWNVRFY